MSVSILNITFDCADAGSIASFWSELTGRPCAKVEMPGNPFWMIESLTVDGPRLVFVDVTEARTSKNRVHLDLAPRGATQDQEVDRVLSLGARIVDDRRQATPGGWIVFADPEGNEFCIEGSG